MPHNSSHTSYTTKKRKQLIPGDTTQKEPLREFDYDENETLYSYQNQADVTRAYKYDGSNVQQFPPVSNNQGINTTANIDASTYNPEVDMGIETGLDYGGSKVGGVYPNVGSSSVAPDKSIMESPSGVKQPGQSAMYPDIKSNILAVPEKTTDFEGAQGILRTPQGGQFLESQFATLGNTQLAQLRDTIQYELSGQGRTGPTANYQTAVISNELTSGIISQIADVRNQIANKLEGGVGIVPGIAREGALREADIEIKNFLTEAGFSPDEIRMVLNPNPGARPLSEGEFDWEGAPEGTVHESDGVTYEKKGGAWEDIDAPVIKESTLGAAEPSTLPTRDAPSEEMISADGLSVSYHGPMQYTNNANELIKWVNRASTSMTGGDFRSLQKEVSKSMELPPNYTVKTDTSTGQVRIAWDANAEQKAREYNAAQPSEGGDLMEVPQRLSPAEERDIIAAAQNYHTQLSRANQLLTSRYENQFKMEITDKELLKKAAELDLEERRIKVTEEEFQALYGPDGLEGMKYEALYGKGGLEDKKYTAIYGTEGIERAKLKAEKDLAQKQLMLEAGIIVFDRNKAKALGLVNPQTGEIRTEFQTLSKQMQDRQLAIQEAESKGASRVQVLDAQGFPTGRYEDIATSKQRNQHVIEAQQYANSLTEQSGRQTLVQPASERQGETRMTSEGTIVGEYGDFVVVQTQTPTFAAQVLGEEISARKNANAIAQDRINADKEMSATMEQLRLTGISTEAATAQSIATTNAESAKAVAQLRLDAETQGISNELTLLEKRIELEAQREGQTLTRQEISMQAEIELQITLSKQRIIEEAAQRGTELNDQIAERLATLQIQKEIGTENSANALAQVTARMEAEKAMATERVGAEKAMAGEAVESAEAIALAQAAAKVTLSADEKAHALDRLEAQITADADAQGLQITSEELKANAQLLMQKEIATMGGTQATAQITAQTEAEKQRLQDKLTTEKGFVEEQRAALEIATDPTVVAQARQVASTFVSNLNEALGQGVQGDFSQAASAMAAELPPAPPGVMWDSTTGKFLQRPGFEGREMAATTQEWISATTGAYKARDRAEQAIREGTRLRTESQLRVQERRQADEDFRQAMLTADIDTAEEAITRQKMAETNQLQNQTKLDNLQMLFGLLANPVQLGFAKKHGLLGQIEAVLGFAIGNVPEAAIGPTIPNINQWQTMDAEEQAFSIANFVEQGGSPTSFMQMVQGAAPAQMQQVQYGVL